MANSNNSTSYELKDIPDVKSLLPTPMIAWWVWPLVALALLAIWLLTRALLRKKKSPLAELQRAREQALSELEKCAAITEPVTRATEVSLATRRYLATALENPALYQTHGEFLSSHTGLAPLPDSLAQQISQFFSHLARSKYAPSTTDEQTANLTPTARDLLEKIHPLAVAAFSQKPKS